MHKIAIIISLVAFTSVSCTSPKGKKTMNFGKFTIVVPAAWKEKKLWIEDSYIGGIVMESGSMAVFDLGWWSNSLDDIDSLTHTIQWKMVDGRKAKLVTANNSRDGYTGIYIDSLWSCSNGTDREYFFQDRFQMGAGNLSKEEQHELIHAFLTLKFSDE